MIWDLSQRIVSVDSLWKLGRVLKLPHHDTQAAVTNHPRSIQMAAFTVLSTWRDGQLNQFTAYAALTAALQEIGFIWLPESESVVSGLID